MKKCIIIINGSGGKGKDSFVNYCSEYADVLNISTVDKVKIAAKLLGWDGTSKNEVDRKFLSDLKLLAGAYSDHSFKFVETYIKYFQTSSIYNIMFIHSREPEEIKRFVKTYPCITMLVKNPGVPDILTNMADANVENYNYDFVIDNDGTLDDLKRNACKFIAAILGDAKSKEE